MVHDEFAEREFWFFRYLLSPKTQRGGIAAPTPPKVRGAMIIPFLGAEGERSFSRGEIKYLFTAMRPVEDFHPPPVDRQGLAFIGKLGRHKTFAVGEHVPGDIVPAEAHDWQYSWVVVDCRNQYIAVAPSKAFNNVENIANVLTAGLRSAVLERYHHSVDVEPVEDPQIFWEVIESSSRIYDLSLTLHSPNPVDLNRDVKELVSDVGKLFSQQDLTFKVVNEGGHLKIPRPLVTRLLDYISWGGGRWSVKRRKDVKDPKPETISSAQSALSTKAQIPVIVDETGQERETDAERYMAATVLSKTAQLYQHKN